jgi:hypothetical protein
MEKGKGPDNFPSTSKLAKIEAEIAVAAYTAVETVVYAAIETGV